MKKWMKWVMQAAGVYNLAWGAMVIIFPVAFFEVLDMQPPLYPMIWQCVGMVIGVYGIGYLAAAVDPVKHWPIVLVGFLGKIFGPIGFVYYVLEGTLPINLGATIIFNDLIWWVPFIKILQVSYRQGELRFT